MLLSSMLSIFSNGILSLLTVRLPLLPLPTPLSDQQLTEWVMQPLSDLLQTRLTSRY